MYRIPSMALCIYFNSQTLFITLILTQSLQDSLFNLFQFSTSYTEKTIGTTIGTKPLLDTVQVHKLFTQNFAISTRKTDQTAFTLIIYYGSAGAIKKELQLTGLTGVASPAKVFTENYFGIIVSLPDQGHWFFLDYLGVFSECTFDTCVDSADLATTKSDFYSAERVTFDHTTVFLLTTDHIMMYNFEISGTKSITKTSSIILSTKFTSEFQLDKSTTIQAQIGCICSQKKLVRFNCFSASFNCIATNWYQSKDCTVAIDNSQ